MFEEYNFFFFTIHNNGIISPSQESNQSDNLAFHADGLYQKTRSLSKKVVREGDLLNPLEWIIFNYISLILEPNPSASNSNPSHLATL